MQDEAVEKLVTIFINARHDVLALTVLFSGGTTESVVDPKVILKTALDLGDCAFILAHNHSSGDPLPSIEDRNITKKIVTGEGYLDLCILDHLIIGFDKYYSMADEGIMPN